MDSDSEDSSQESDYDVDSDAESVCSTLSTFSQQTTEPSLKVFIKNFPPSVKREDIEGHIQSHGLSGNVRNVRLFYGKNGKPKGSGYITITPPSAGRKAISVLNGSLLLGKYKIEAKKFKDRKGRRRPSKHTSDPRQPSDTRGKPAPVPLQERESTIYRVFVGAEKSGKLPLTIESSHLQEHFRNFKVYPENIYIVTTPKTKQSKGYGFAMFKSKQTAESAIQRLNGSCLHGCKLKVDFAKGKEGGVSHTDQCESHKASPQRPGNTGKSPKKMNQPNKTHIEEGLNVASSCNPAAPSVAYKVFVSMMPVSVQSHHLHHHFNMFQADILKVNIPEGKQQQNRRYGFVVFSTFDSAERAVQTLNGSNLHGSKIKVQHDKHSSASAQNLTTHPAVHLPQPLPPQSPTTTSPSVSNIVCFSNLNPEIDSDSITTLCKGKVIKLYFIEVDFNCRKAIITFSSQEDAREAIKQFDGKDFLGQTVSADYYSPPQQPHHPVVEHTPVGAYMYPVKVTQLAPTVNEVNLRSIFEAAGEIVECCVLNRYGHVNFSLESEAETAVVMFNGKAIDGAIVNVSKRPPRPVKACNFPLTSPPCQPAMVEVSNLNPTLQIHEHWKSLTDVFSVYKSAKVENVTPPNALITFGDMNEAHKATDVLNQSFISGSLVQVTVKPNQQDEPQHIPTRPEVVPTTELQDTILLSSAQCNLLTSIRPSGSSLYQELIQPFMANPNVKIELLLAEVALHFTGKQDAVESASCHFRVHLQQLVPVEIECAQALIELYPDLPKEMRGKYGVTLVGLQEGTSLIKLDGPQSGVSEARAEIGNLISCFQKLVAQPYLVLTTDLLASARKRFKNEGINVFISHLPCSPEITIYSFSQDDQEKAQKIMCSKPCTRYVPFQPNTSLKELPLNDIATEFCVSVDVNESERKIYVRAFVRQDVLSAEERIKDYILKMSVQIAAFECSPEQMLFLRCKLRSQKEAMQPVLDSLPAEVLMDSVRPLHFKGSPLDIENSQKQLLEGPLLQGLQFRSFTFKAQQKFFHQIQQHVLKPIKREHPDFEYVQLVSEGEQAPKSRRGSMKTEESEFTVTILSQDVEVFDDAVSALEDINRSVKTLSVRHSNALECIQEKVQDYEHQYRVEIIVRKDSSKVLIFGLTDEEAGQCLTELREHIDSNVVIEKYIKVDRRQVKYFQQKKSDEWKKLRGICKAFKMFDHRRQETDTALIRVEGTVQQVREVQQKLNAIQDLDIITKDFTMNIEKRYNRMWLKHWEAVIKEKEELYDIIIEVSKKRDAGVKTEEEGLNITYSFTLCGSDENGLDEAEEELSKTHTAQKIINLSEMAAKQLDKGRREKELHVTDQYTVDMFIDFRGSRVILTAPSECHDDLEAAEGEIQRFVGNHTLMEKDIMVDDQVVGLILCSNKSKHSPHLVHANQISKPHGVSIQCLRHPLRGLRLRGSPEGIIQVEPLIRQSVIAQIQATVDKVQFPVDASLLPYFESPEFVHFNSKIRDELFVLSMFPKSRGSNKVMKSVYVQTTTSASCIKLEICKGNIINEHTSVDAIVNAANEDLQHIGGLARSIVEAGGEVIQKESSEYTKRNGKLKTGDVVCLGPGNLACKKIIHAVGPRWVDGSKGEEQALYFTVLSCLQACQREGFESIALPAISTGIFGVPDQVCVQASLKAIRDFCQVTPNTCIANVRFVLLQDFAAERFALALDSDILLGCTLSESLATTCTTFSHDYTWEWMDDTGTFTPYESQLSAQLNDAYKNSPNGSASFIVNGQSYTVHFDTMLQVNTVTKFTRRMRRVSPSSATATTEQPSMLWKYCNDLQRWTPYKPDDSQAIEKMYQSQKPAQLVIKGKVYGFDFSQMSQINMETNYRRPIMRSIRKKSEVPVPITQAPGVEQNRIMITLCGPTANLPIAKNRFDDKLKNALKNGNIAFPTSLEKKVISIVKQHRLTFSIRADSGDHKKGKKRLVFHGLSSAVNEALSAIQEEIINYHAATFEVVEVPQEWQSQTQNLEIFPVHSGSAEWHKVVGNFNSTLPNTVIKVIRIQNKWLWERYAQHKQRLAYKNDGNVNERELFHGTRGNDPRLIYEGEDGFDMRYSSPGMWGLANYFAVNASYSNDYAYTRSDGSREMFMVKVLTGDSYQCSSNSKLRMPPEKQGMGGGGQLARVRYDTVTGTTRGSQVFMTYDNDKAYPAYLIQYT